MTIKISKSNTSQYYIQLKQSFDKDITINLLILRVKFGNFYLSIKFLEDYSDKVSDILYRIGIKHY